MSIKLGSPVQDLEVLLTKNSDFNAIIRRKNGVAWDVGTELTLRFSNGGVWTATITGADAVFSEDKAVVDAMSTANPRKVLLYYTLGAADVTWASGSITVGG